MYHTASGKQYTYNNMDAAPTFRPNDDPFAPGKYLVEACIICYPYKQGSVLDENAFPDSVIDLGRKGNTKFFFVSEENGADLVKLPWLDACKKADELNATYHNLMQNCANTCNWSNAPAHLLKRDNLVYWK